MGKQRIYTELFTHACGRRRKQETTILTYAVIAIRVPVHANSRRFRLYLIFMLIYSRFNKQQLI